MGCAVALIALGVGYLVILNASKEKEGLKLLGQVIGILIMIAALMSAMCSATKCMKMGNYSMSAKAASCPVSAHKLAGPGSQE